MPKQRLVDFRGGLNKKISPHMIGDTQGQAANDVDLGSVRLQGRRKIDPDEKAAGTFFYEVGNIVTSEERKPRWVSWDPKDDSYIPGAIDFAVWNRDLYVAVNTSPGEIQVFRDGGLDADLLGFDPPLTVTLSTGSGFPTNTELHAPVTGREEIDDSTTYITVDTQQAGTIQWGSTSSSLGNYRHVGTASGVDADNAGRTWYTWRKYIGGSATNTYAYATSNSSSPKALLYAQTLVSNAYTIWMTDNWTTVGWDRTQTGWSEANNHPAASGHSNASTQSYNVFTRSGASTIYAIGSGSGAQCYNITGGGTESGGTATEGPFYFANYKFRWTRDSGLAGGSVGEKPISPSNRWEVRKIKHGSVYLGMGYTGAPAEVIDPYARIFYTNLDLEEDNFFGAEPTQHSSSDGATVTKGSFSGYGPTNGFSDFYDNNSSNWMFWFLFTNPTTGIDEITIWCDGNYKGNVPGPVDGVNPSSITEIIIGGRRWYRGQYVGPVDNGYHYKIRVPYTWEYYKLHVNHPGYPKTTGTREIIWNGATIQSLSNVSESDHNNQQIIGSSTYTASGSDRNGSGDVYEYAVTRVTTNPTTYTPLVFTPVTQPSSGESAQYRYSIEHKDYKFAGGQEGIPDTPAYTRDWARYYLYRVATTADNSFGVASWENDPAKGTVGDGWLRSGSEKRMITSDTQGYFVQNVRVEDGLPVISQEMTRLDQAGITVNPADELHYLPRRLNFTITQPSNYSNNGHLCFKLIRKDSFGDIDLGYFKKTSINLSMNGQSCDITGLNSSTQYRLRWHCYQESTLTVYNAATSANVTAKSEEAGILTALGTTLTFTINFADSGNYGFDIWLEERVLQPVAESSAGDIWALVGSWDGFKYGSNSQLGRSDYLDVFNLGLTTSSLGGTESQTLPPKYLKFLKESNNFFFAVGTQLTADERYVNAEVNKADSYLFISEYNNPRNWPLEGFLEFDDAITGMFPYPGEMIVWTQSGTYRVFGSAHDQMRKIKLATTEGMIAGYHRTAALVQNYLVWVSQAGICVYNGTAVQNVTRTRMEVFPSLGTGAHAGQYDGQYYVVGENERGWMVDFALEGFPCVEVNLGEADRPALTNNNEEALTPVLVYRASTNQLYSRRGIINSNEQTRNIWSYKTRGFDAQAFGALKLVRSVVLNGTGSGQIQIYLDGIPVFDAAGKTVSIKQPMPNSTTQPARVYLPACPIDPATSLKNQYGLPVADVWSVEIISWDGQLDWIDSEYEILSQ